MDMLLLSIYSLVEARYNCKCLSYIVVSLVFTLCSEYELTPTFDSVIDHGIIIILVQVLH